MARKAEGASSLRPTIRSPADELGPRATRAIEKILAATRVIFLSRGYGGTTIDDIAQAAGISRASFYTYFPSKRDVLLALGESSAHAVEEVIAGLDAVPDDWNDAHIAEFVDRYFTLLDEHGSFALAWAQAAHEDETIRVAGMRRNLRMCRELGLAVGRLRERPFDDAQTVGLALFASFEGNWSYLNHYGAAVDPDAVKEVVTGFVLAAIRD